MDVISTARQTPEDANFLIVFKLLDLTLVDKRSQLRVAGEAVCQIADLFCDRFQLNSEIIRQNISSDIVIDSQLGLSYGIGVPLAQAIISSSPILGFTSPTQTTSYPSSKSQVSKAPLALTSNRNFIARMRRSAQRFLHLQ